VIRDFRYALRTLAKNPAFTLVAVLTLALGIAANTAIFSAVDAVLLNPLPFAHPKQLVEITKTMPMFGLSQSDSSPLDYQDYRAHMKSFSELAAVARTQFSLTGDRQPERLPGMRVTSSLFPLVGVNPVLGRAFSAEEERWGQHQVVILSEPLWTSHFGADPHVLGKQIPLDGENYTIIGVARPMLRFLGEADLWTPLSFSPAQLAPNQRGHQFIDVIGRVKAGVSQAQVQDDLRNSATQMTGRFPDWYPKGWSLAAAPLADRVSGPIRTPLLVLVGAVALVLLIGCANVANLLLARASARRKEITIRAALGASRGRIVRQLLIESSVIALVAGAVGLLASIWVLAWFEHAAPAQLLSGQHLNANGSMAAFTLLASIVSTVIFGLVPAIASSNGDLNDTLKESSRGASGSASTQRLRSTLVACEVALSLTLLSSAGLLVRSFVRLHSANPGFESAGLATFRISLPVTEYKEMPPVAAFYSQLLSRVSALPGVTQVAAINALPFTGSSSGGTFNIIGRPWPPNSDQPDVEWRQVTAGYFQTMRIPLLRGRSIGEQDGAGAPNVVVVDDVFAKQIFPNEDAIGKQLSGGGSDGYTIVGIVGGVRHDSLTKPYRPTIYYSAMQSPNRAMSIVWRTNSGDAMRLLGAVRGELQSLNRNLPIFRSASMDQLIGTSLARTRFATTLLGVFAALAVLLAAIGIYGVVSYMVGQRTREIGIRMAMGAEASDAIRLILRQGSGPILAGIAAGFVASLAATRTFSSLLYGVSATDPMVFVAVSVFLAGVAFAASYVPARRATKVDPMVALRYE